MGLLLSVLALFTSCAVAGMLTSRNLCGFTVQRASMYRAFFRQGLMLR